MRFHPRADLLRLWKAPGLERLGLASSRLEFQTLSGEQRLPVHLRLDRAGQPAGSNNEFVRRHLR